MSNIQRLMLCNNSIECLLNYTCLAESSASDLAALFCSLRRPAGRSRSPAPAPARPHAPHSRASRRSERCTFVRSTHVLPVFSPRVPKSLNNLWFQYGRRRIPRRFRRSLTNLRRQVSPASKAHTYHVSHLILCR